MSETTPFGLPDAAQRLGVPVRVLRHAMRTGKIPTPPGLTATSPLPSGWMESAEAALATDPKALNRVFARKVPPFVRYEGTSAWRKYKRRVREYGLFRTGAAKAG